MGIITRKGNKQLTNLDGTMRLGMGRRNLKVTQEGIAANAPTIFDYLLNDSTDSLFRIIGEGVAEIAGGSVPANSGVEFAATLIPYSGLDSIPIVETWKAAGEGVSPFGGVRPSNPVDTGTSFEFRQIYSETVGVIPDDATSGNIKIYVTVENANSSSWTYTGDFVKYYIIAKSAEV